MRRQIWLLLAIAMPLAPTTATADDDETSALTLDGVLLVPLGEGGTYNLSAGFGGSLGVVFDHAQLSLGGFAAFGLGEPSANDIARDVYDVNGDIGLRFSLGDHVALFGGVGPDFIATTTRNGTETARGTTVGVHARLGIEASLGRHFLLGTQVGYLGAIVPGTGDDLQGLLFSLSVGFRTAEDQTPPEPDVPDNPNYHPLPPGNDPVLVPEPAPQPGPERVPAIGEPPSCQHLTCPTDQCATLEFGGCLGATGCVDRASCWCAPCPGTIIAPDMER